MFLLSVIFNILFQRFLLTLRFDQARIEKIHLTKHLDVRQKNFAARRVSNSLVDVYRCDETLSLLFHILVSYLWKNIYFESSRLKFECVWKIIC